MEVSVEHQHPQKSMSNIKLKSPKASRVWQASDGSTHSSEAAAKKQEVRIALRSTILEFVPKGGDMRISTGDLADILVARPDSFIHLLQVSRRYR
jgi:hypothetical protein